MTPGVTPDGEKFDGRMVAPLIPNHVALVSQGRVSGAMVGDSGLNARYALDTLQRIAAERDRARQANENSPLGRGRPRLLQTSLGAFIHERRRDTVRERLRDKRGQVDGDVRVQVLGIERFRGSRITCSCGPLRARAPRWPWSS